MRISKPTELEYMLKMQQYSVPILGMGNRLPRTIVMRSPLLQLCWSWTGVWTGLKSQCHPGNEPAPGASSSRLLCSQVCYRDTQGQSFSIPLALPSYWQKTKSSWQWLPWHFLQAAGSPALEQTCLSASDITVLQHHPHIWRSASGHSAHAASIWSHRVKSEFSQNFIWR